MSVSYDVFTTAFLSKVVDYDLQMRDYEQIQMVDSFMKRSIASFKPICQYDLSSTTDDTARAFNVDIPEEDIDEIVDIVSEGMLVQWLKPYVYRQEALENVMNTKDFSTFSPAELLLRVRETYNDARRNHTNMMREYSYAHGDIGSLAL